LSVIYDARSEARNSTSAPTAAAEGWIEER
jgi:hypothetical protein